MPCILVHTYILLAALHGVHKIHTYIDQVVGGELLSVVDCNHCKHVSNTYMAVCCVHPRMSVYLCVRVCVCAYV